MQEPLVVTITVNVKDANGKNCYDGSHVWSGMGELEETMLLATLQDAVTDLGKQKAEAKSKGSSR